MKKIVIAGGLGFIGNLLADRFRKNGYEVLIISRSEGNISWNPSELTKSFEKSEMVINLAGKSINCRHNKKNQKEIIESRLATTLLIGNAILACKNPPKIWINASATGIYKSSLTNPMSEEMTNFNSDFLAEVVKKWENSFFSFKLQNTRQIALRTSVVLGKNANALTPVIVLSRLGLGGKQGTGKQMFSWIHIEDYFRILLFLSEKTEINGIINCTSPNPVSNKEFMQMVCRVLQVRIRIPAPAFAVKAGAFAIGTESSLILSSSYIVPKRLIQEGYKFAFPKIKDALTDILA